MSCRLLHFDGRPDFFALGSSGSNLAHAASVRSNRLVTAMVSTRSPVFRFCLVANPSTGDLAKFRSPTRRQHHQPSPDTGPTSRQALGNILLPIPLMDAHGADALHWFMACSGSPWAQRRVGPGPLDEIVRKVLMTYWNTASFFSLYASHATWAPQTAHLINERPILDRWIL